MNQIEKLRADVRAQLDELTAVVDEFEQTVDDAERTLTDTTLGEMEN